MPMPYGLDKLFRCLFLIIFLELIFQLVDHDTIHCKNVTLNPMIAKTDGSRGWKDAELCCSEMQMLGYHHITLKIIISKSSFGPVEVVKYDYASMYTLR